MSTKQKWVTEWVSEWVSDKVTYWAVRWQLNTSRYSAIRYMYWIVSKSVDFHRWGYLVRFFNPLVKLGTWPGLSNHTLVGWMPSIALCGYPLGNIKLDTYLQQLPFLFIIQLIQNFRGEYLVVLFSIDSWSRDDYIQYIFYSDFRLFILLYNATLTWPPLMTCKMAAVFLSEKLCTLKTWPAAL